MDHLAAIFLIMFVGCSAQYEDIKWTSGKAGANVEQDSADCSRRPNLPRSTDISRAWVSCPDLMLKINQCQVCFI